MGWKSSSYNYKEIAIIAFLCFFAFLLFSNTLNHKYNLDDYLVIENNEIVQRGFGGLHEIFTTNYADFQGKGMDYRPLVKASFATDYQLFGENLFVFHLNNILLFLATIILLFYVLKRFFKDFNAWAIALMCLIFIVHPFNSEVVCSLKNRDHLLSFFFVLICFLSAFYYHKSNDKKIIPIIAITFILGLMSKLSTVPYLVIIPAALYLQNWKLDKKIIRVFATLFITIVCYYIFVEAFIGGYSTSRKVLFIENPIPHEASIFNKVSMILIGCFFYVEKLFVPINLSCYYGYDALGLTNYWSLKTYISLFTGLVIVGGFIYACKRKSLLAVPLGLFIINMAIAANVFAYVPGVVGDRIAYGGIVLSFAIFAVLIILRQTFIKKEFVMFGLALISLVYAGQTFSRNKAWTDRKALYGADATNDNKSAKVHALYGEELLGTYIGGGKVNKALLDESKKHFVLAMNILPGYPTANNKYGLILSRYENNPQGGLPYLRRAVEINPKFEDAQFNLGATYQNLGDTLNAVKHYKEVLKLNPNRQKAVENIYRLSQ